MELVSANTKNYLFLTMSQYNEEDKLVRARVTMRRDQAFWEGGNSFIACESFRISSAPSQGGLYYKILPDNFYVGAISRTTVPDEEKSGFENLLKSGNTLRADTVSPAAIAADTVLQIQVSPCVSALPNVGTDLVPSDPATFLPIIGELWNDHGIQQGQQIRMVCNNNNNPVMLTGVVQNKPLMNINGRGAGPNSLFYPITGYWIIPDSEDGDPIADIVSGAGAQGQLEISNVGCIGLGQSEDLTATMTKFLGGDVYFEPTKGPDGSLLTVPAALRKQGLVFMGPVGIEVSGIPGGIYLHDAGGEITGLRYKIYWDTSELKEGTPVYVKIPANGAIAAHNQYGVITAIPDNWIHPFQIVDHVGFGPVRGCTLGGGWYKASPSFYTWLNNNANSWGTTSDNNPQPAHGADALANMLDKAVPWVLSQTTAHVPHDIYTNLEVKVDQSNSDASMNAFHAALPITAFQIRKGNDRTSNKIERRACALGEQKFIYTPNELYWTFNNPQGGLKDDNTPLTATPYLLQTHENGGFKVAWDGTFSEFYMSVAMHDALGLNDYFEYYHTEQTKDSSGWDLCLQQPISDAKPWAHTFASSVLHVKASNVFVPGGTPLVPVDANAIAIGAPVVLEHGSTVYTLVSKSVIKDSEETSTSVKVYPVIQYDENNEPIYHWTNLPEAIMGNTQQVSVESFGTYSGINIVIPNLPFQPMLGTASDDRILASLRLPFEYGTDNKTSGIVNETDFSYYGDLLFNSDSSRSYLRITTDQQLYDCDVEARLIRRDGGMEVLQLPYLGQFEIKLRFLQTQ